MKTSTAIGAACGLALVGGTIRVVTLNNPPPPAQAVVASQATEPFQFAFAAPANDKGINRIDAPPGSSHLLGTIEVPAHLVGAMCVGDLLADNNASVHAGNNVQLRSLSMVTAFDVERGPSADTIFDGDLVLGETIEVWVIIGDDGSLQNGNSTFSGAVWTVILSCTPPPPPTTVTTPPPSTTPSTAPPSTSTTTPSTVPSTTAPPTTAPTAATTPSTTSTTHVNEGLSQGGEDG